MKVKVKYKKLSSGKIVIRLEAENKEEKRILRLLTKKYAWCLSTGVPYANDGSFTNLSPATAMVVN